MLAQILELSLIVSGPTNLYRHDLWALNYISVKAFTRVSNVRGTEPDDVTTIVQFPDPDDAYESALRLASLSMRHVRPANTPRQELKLALSDGKDQPLILIYLL